MSILSERQLTAKPVISFIVPTGNEGESLIPHIFTFVKQFNQMINDPAEFVLGTDISNPSTVEAMDWLSKIGLCKSYILTGRIGKGGTIKNVGQFVNGEIIVILDADFPVSIEELQNAIRSLTTNEADMVIGKRVGRSDGVSRAFLSAGYNLLVRILFKTKIKDHQAGFKVLSKRLFSNIIQYSRTDGLGFDTELIVRAKQLGAKVKVIPVAWKEKREKNSSNIFSMRALLTMFFDLLTLRLLTNRPHNGIFRRLKVGRILGTEGRTVATEYMTVIHTRHDKLLSIARNLYLIVAFRK